MIRRTGVLLVVSLIWSAASGGPIDRIEPPFWWQGFENRELQILVHGHDVSSFDVAIDHAGITLQRVERVSSPNYLFLYLDIGPDAAAGRFNIAFDNGDMRFEHAYELRARSTDPEHARGFSPADVIYLVTPDRFANGDPSNDSVAGYADVLDREDDYGRHGGDLAGLSQSLGYIADMGFTSIWLNPILENAVPKGSYHGYSTTDFYGVDPRFGSNEQYRELVAEARRHGLGIIMDMITNHAGAGHWWMEDPPTEDWFNVPDTKSITSHARTTNQDPYASGFDKAAHADGWFVESMPDLNQRNALLADYLVQNAIWWIEYVGLGGIRMDTQPYPDKDFMADWARRIMREYPDFNITGEEWSGSPAIVAYWQAGKTNHDGTEQAMPSMLDFPVQIALRESLTQEGKSWGSVWTPVYEMLGHDFLYPDPSILVTFADNHDMDRIVPQLGDDPALFRMAMAFYLTTRGIPQIYYGTEVFATHELGAGHGALRMEFPGGWPDHDKNAFTGAGLSDAERDAQDFMRRLLNWRKDKTVIHTGNLMQFTPVRHVYAFFRYDDSDTVMVVFNRGAEAVTLDTARFAERLGDSTRATDVISGRRISIDDSIELEPMSVMILEVE